MSPFRPDLVDVWIFRDRTPGPSPASRSALGAAGLHQAAGIAEDAGAEAPGSGILADGVADDASSDAPIEILLLRRAKDDSILPGLWQGVSGGLDGDENAGAAALRELSEETGFGPDQIEGFYHLDQVNQFLEQSLGGVVTAAVFAVRVAARAEPVLSREHDAMHWVTPGEALQLAVWPDYRESIRRIVENLLDPERASWFELKLNGERVRP